MATYTSTTNATNKSRNESSQRARYRSAAPSDSRLSTPISDFDSASFDTLQHHPASDRPDRKEPADIQRSAEATATSDSQRAANSGHIAIATTVNPTTCQRSRVAKARSLSVAATAASNNQAQPPAACSMRHRPEFQNCLPAAHAHAPATSTGDNSCATPGTTAYVAKSPTSTTSANFNNVVHRRPGRFEQSLAAIDQSAGR